MAELSQSDGNSQHSDSDDQDFDPSAEMMIFDHDDERTLDEEEALSNSESVTQELSQLENEKDMPIEQLLAMYGYDGNRGASTSRLPTGFGDQILGSEDLTLDKDEIARDLLQHTDHDRETSVNDLLDSVDITASSQTVRLLRSADQEAQLSDEESSTSEDDSLDLDYEPRPDDWKKTIQVGTEYQADTPECQCRPSEGVDKESDDNLVWSPTRLSEEEVVQYLHECFEFKQQPSNGMPMLPNGSHLRDDEELLCLLHKCAYQVNEALEKRRASTGVLHNESLVSFNQWSEEECRNFENGLCIYGKNFFLIQQNKVPTKSVGELVQFYYLWKKTERHDFFASKFRLEKKKYALHPGITDYMDRFLDEVENSANSPSSRAERVVSPGIRSLLSADVKQRLCHEADQCSEECGESCTSTLLNMTAPPDSTFGTNCFIPLKPIDEEKGLCSSSALDDMHSLLSNQSALDSAVMGLENAVHSSTGQIDEYGVNELHIASGTENAGLPLFTEPFVNGGTNQDEAAICNGISLFHHVDSTLAGERNVVSGSDVIVDDSRSLCKRAFDSIAGEGSEMFSKRVRTELQDCNVISLSDKDRESNNSSLVDSHQPTESGMYKTTSIIDSTFSSVNS